MVILALLTGFLLAKGLQWVGFVAYNDSLFHQGYLLGFWIWLVVSRILFSAAWLWANVKIVDYLHATGWFWFPKPRPDWRTKKEEGVDKSGDILSWGVAISIAWLVGEFVIRVATWTNPPYLPPPGSG